MSSVCLPKCSGRDGVVDLGQGGCEPLTDGLEVVDGECNVKDENDEQELTEEKQRCIGQSG